MEVGGKEGLAEGEMEERIGRDSAGQGKLGMDC